MKMIPGTPYGTHSLAEKRVFDKLRSAFINKSSDSLTSYHSLNLTRHKYKRFGEIDFLVIGPPGIFVLEVKGGGVTCHNGIWRYSNRYGEVFESDEGPFKQAESALHGLIQKLSENFPSHTISQFSIGYGVIFPDCEWRVAGSEWDPQILADARGFRDFDQWLNNLFMYWRNKDFRQRKADKKALKLLCSFLRPEFESIIPLHIQAGHAEEEVVSMTEDQMSLVDVVVANQRVLCPGGAGTGKTFMAMELARRWTTEGMNVVLACRSPWLRHYLEARFCIPRLTVTLAESIGTACRRAQLDQFDALIVDEGQDLFELESLDKLDTALKNGLNDGRWCLFYDINNQSGLFGGIDQEAIDYISSIQHTQVPLTRNCRNTQVILKKVQTTLGADMGICGAGVGPKVKTQVAKDREALAEMLEREIHEIVEQGGISSGNVTILSPFPFKESSVSLLDKTPAREIIVLDEYSLRNFPLSKITFAEISSFKGLENEAIIIVDLEPPNDCGDSKALHYVAMSRARAVLSIIYKA